MSSNPAAKPRSNAKRALLILGLLAIGFAVLLLLLPRESVEFISKHDGRQFADPHPSLAGPRPTFYAFSANPDEVEKTLVQDAERNSWREIVGSNLVADKLFVPHGGERERVKFIRVAKKSDPWIDELKLPEGTSCFAIVHHKPSWLDRQWAAVKKWFGR